MANIFNVSYYKDVINYFSRDEREIIVNLQASGLLKNCERCVRCRRNCVLRKNRRYKGNYCSYCGTCKLSKSICNGTFFQNSRVNLATEFEIIYLWSNNISVKNSANLTGISKKTIIQYFSYCRDIVSWKLVSDPGRFQFGGPGTVVQIDESCVSKRKFNRGRIVREKWVIGIYDTEQKRGVVVFVARRNQQNLIPVILNFVLPGTEIWTDEWRAYAGLNQQGFIHRTVNHSRYFVDPVTGVCTNGVEGYWSRLKRFCRETNVLWSTLLPEHVDEFMWRETYCRGAVAFNIILQHIRERYPL